MNRHTTKESNAEASFVNIWMVCAPPDAPVYIREFEFDPTRKWRFDFAWPDHRIAVEIEGLGRRGKGGRSKAGGHQTLKGFVADCEKYNSAAELGWRLLRYTTIDLEKRPVQCIEQIIRTLYLTEAKLCRDQAKRSSGASRP